MKTKLTHPMATYFGSLRKTGAQHPGERLCLLHALNTQDVNLSAYNGFQMKV